VLKGKKGGSTGFLHAFVREEKTKGNAEGERRIEGKSGFYEVTLL